MKFFALILISLLSIPNSKSIVETINLNNVRKSNSAFTTVSNSDNNTTFKPKASMNCNNLKLYISQTIPNPTWSVTTPKEKL